MDGISFLTTRLSNAVLGRQYMFCLLLGLGRAACWRSDLEYSIFLEMMESIVGFLLSFTASKTTFFN